VEIVPHRGDDRDKALNPDHADRHLQDTPFHTEKIPEHKHAQGSSRDRDHAQGHNHHDPRHKPAHAAGIIFPKCYEQVPELIDRVMKQHRKIKSDPQGGDHRFGIGHPAEEGIKDRAIEREHGARQRDRPEE